MIVVTLAAVAIFLIVQSLPAFGATSETASLLSSNFWEYVAPLLFGTIWAAFLALLVAVPLSSASRCSSRTTPRAASRSPRLRGRSARRRPSVVYGLWGILVFAPSVVPTYKWLNENLGWIPLFSGQVLNSGRTILTAALVLAVMVVPIITAICREIFLQTPRLHEAALALGATRWEMIRMAVLPFGRSGIVSASMLGLGRALGETMAVAMVLSATNVVTLNLLTSQNPSTIAANIALTFPRRTPSTSTSSSRRA
jgi:phosphate transport system permease protein